MENFFNFEAYKWILLPLSIFVARLINEAIGTLRIMFLARGNKVVAPLLGFIEVLMWIIIIGQIMQNLSNIFCYIAYAGGFAVGNLVGMLIENKLAMGVTLIHVITRKNTVALQENLRKNNYGFTKIAGKDIDGIENILFIIVKRKELNNVIKIIKNFNPNAFFTIEDLRNINAGKHPLKGETISSNLLSKFNFSFIKKYFTSHRKKDLVPENEEIQ